MFFPYILGNITSAKRELIAREVNVADNYLYYKIIEMDIILLLLQMLLRCNDKDI